jgi:SDR family mycofactocin-dependent oxidoreductase
MGQLDGQVAFITGASRAQGRAHAIALAREGADVIVTDIGHDLAGLRYSLGTEQELEETAELVRKEGRRAIARLADVRDQAALDAAVAAGIAEFGRIDILIANAAINHFGPSWELTEEQWQLVVDINLSGVWRSAKAVAPHMVAQKSGAIVLISSVNGLEPASNYAHYVAAKHGVIGLMGSLALELAPHSVRCNAISPGFVKSGMTTFQDQLDKYAGHPGATMDILDDAGRGFHPFEGITYLEPEDIAQAAVWLVSPKARAVTGITVPVEAGHLLVPAKVWR